MKRKFLITSLTSCSGCIATLFTLDIFLDFFERINLTYFPFLTDSKTISECDVSLVEGSITNENQIEIVKEIRKKSKKVIALGTCAAYGGILSLSNELQVEPISNIIEIDGFIPGCPPPLKLFGNSLINLLENKPIVLSQKNLCSNCPLRGDKNLSSNTQINKILPDIRESTSNIDDKKCFLEKGILCLGPITREGCECRCISIGVPCEGCLGPIKEDFTANIVNFLSILKIKKNLRSYDGLYYRFSKPKLREIEK